jgi:acetyl-CoA carboxylase biotin carboxylase subunit
LAAELRQGLANAAVALCKEVGYKNAGTVEFVFDNIERTYYFIEMNTRIQGEHPVSEMVSGIDLIKLQLQIAGGLPLSMSQDDIIISGHAIECGINAEDPEINFAPAPGKLPTPARHAASESGWTAIETGYAVSPVYDSMTGTWRNTGPSCETART